MFFGDSTHSLDAKFRVHLPKRFAPALETEPDGTTRVVLTRGFERSVFLFSGQGFERVLARLATAPFGGADQRKIQRMFFSNTHRLSLDGQGRVVLPAKLRAYAGIEKEVVIVGVAERAEIWDRVAWDRYEAENEDAYDALDQVLVERGGSE